MSVAETPDPEHRTLPILSHGPHHHPRERRRLRRCRGAGGRPAAERPAGDRCAGGCGACGGLRHERGGLPLRGAQGDAACPRPSPVPRRPRPAAAPGALRAGHARAARAGRPVFPAHRGRGDRRPPLHRRDRHRAPVRPAGRRGRPPAPAGAQPHRPGAGLVGRPQQTGCEGGDPLGEARRRSRRAVRATRGRFSRPCRCTCSQGWSATTWRGCASSIWRTRARSRRCSWRSCGSRSGAGRCRSTRRCAGSTPRRSCPSAKSRRGRRRTTSSGPTPTTLRCSQAALYGLVEQVGAELRLRRRAARRVAVALDYSDGVRCTRQAAARPATANDITLFEVARPVLELAWARRVRVRRLRLACDRLVFPPAQLELFPADGAASGRNARPAGGRARRRAPPLRRRSRCRLGRSGLRGHAEESTSPAPMRRHECAMVPLVVRSHYSLMRGTASVRRLCRAARRMGYERLALTDTDNLYGLWPFLSACRAEGLTPIVGAEVTEPGHGRRAVCLVETDEGYRNLCRLLTRRHLTPEEFDLAAALPAHAAGLTVLTVDPGLLAALAAAGVAAAAMLRATAPGRPPAARGRGPGRAPRWWRSPTASASAADEHRTPPHPARDRRQHLPLAPRRGGLRAAGCLARPARGLRRAVRDAAAGAPAAAEIAARLHVHRPALRHGAPAARRARCGECRRPACARRPMRAPTGATAASSRKPVVERLEHELALIGRMGFAAYFLIVRDIVRLSPRTCGRGSGAASLVAYCLGITNVCPLKHNLYFERFLNPGPHGSARHRRRLRLGRARRGAGRRARAPPRPRRHGGQPRPVPAAHGGARGRQGLRPDRGRDRPGVRSACPGTGTPRRSTPTCWPRCGGGPRREALEFPPPWPEILGFARRLIGTPRHLSVHPGGVVITPRPIDEYVPRRARPQGGPDHPVGEGRRRGRGAGQDRSARQPQPGGDPRRPRQAAGERAAGSTSPAGSPRTISPPSRPSPRAAPWAASTSRARPCACCSRSRAWATSSTWSSTAASSGRPPTTTSASTSGACTAAPGTPIHPLLSEVLEETFGIMVYQEDVSRAAVALAGFSHAEADGLRKILSKKDRAAAAAGLCPALPGRRPRPRGRRRADRRDLGHDDELRRVLVLQAAQRLLRAGLVPGGLPQDPPPGRVHGGGDQQPGRVLQRLRLRLRGPAPGADRAPAGREREPRALVRERRPPCGWGCSRSRASRRRPSERIVPARGQPYAGLARFPGPGPAGRGRGPRARPRRGARPPGAGRGARGAPVGDRRGGHARAPPPAGGRDALAVRDAGRRRRRAAPRCRPTTRTNACAASSPCSGSSATATRWSSTPTPCAGRARCGRSISRGASAGGCASRAGSSAASSSPPKTGEPMEFLTFEDETGLVETTFFPQAYRRFCHLLDRGAAVSAVGHSGGGLGGRHPDGRPGGAPAVPWTAAR